MMRMSNLQSLRLPKTGGIRDYQCRVSRLMAVSVKEILAERIDPSIPYFRIFRSAGSAPSGGRRGTWCDPMEEAGRRIRLKPPEERVWLR